MVEVLAAIGFGAKELFNYNRQSFKFDQDQRLEREQLRLKMQVKRFELFREDVRDLVELTVGRMDVYHLVGALFLEFCVSFFCEGRVQASAPPFLLSLFLLSNACAFVYLLLAVWLSMHASIASHSFGVRLLTRFVRLPIPSPQQITNIASRLSDFENQGLSKVLRVPMVEEGHTWHNLAPPGDNMPSSPSVGENPAAGPPIEHRPGGASSSTATPAAAAQAAQPASLDAVKETPNTRPVPPQPSSPTTDAGNLLGSGEMPFSGMDMLLRPAARAPGLHVQLFRRLQAKWQCYDAYCRVCMALGVNQILQCLSYYAIVHTLVENRSPSAGYALIIIFQGCALALSVLDVAGLKRRAIFAVQAIGALPPFLAARAVVHAPRDENGVLDPLHFYPTTPAMFMLQVLWLEILLRVAAPSADDASLPRRFRTVLFLDVFGDGADPTEAENGPPEPKVNTWGSQEQRQLVSERISGAEAALEIAEAAFRRWHAVPSMILTEAQQAELGRLRAELSLWRRALVGELAWQSARSGLPHESSWGQEVTRPWGDLQPDERAEDPFAGCVLGPFEHDTGYETMPYHYDLERMHYMWDGPGGRPILTIEAVTASVRGLEAAVRLLLAMGEQSASFEEEAQLPDDPLPQALPEPEALDAQTLIAGGLLHAWKRFSSERRHSEGDAIERVGSLDRPLLRRRSFGDEALRSPTGAEQKSEPPAIFPPPCIAGPQARHFAPARLPWQVLHSLTRVLQFAWGYAGFMALLRELGLYRIDFQQHPGKAERRLSAAELWDFTPLQVIWPHGGDFFEPQMLSCLPTDGARFQDLLIGSPFAMCRASSTGSASSWLGAGPLEDAEGSADAPPSESSGALRVGELAEDAFPSGATAFCGPAAAAPLGSPRPPCLLGLLVPGGLAVWAWGSPFGSARVLPISGKPWRIVAGALARCRGYGPSPELLAWDSLDSGLQKGEDRGWCLTLVGWDGSRLPVAAVRLPTGLLEPPGPEASAKPRFSIPPSQLSSTLPSETRQVVALHLSPQHLRLWALFSDGSLQAWSLLQHARLGGWQLRWPDDAGGGLFMAAAICEEASGALYVAGQGSVRPEILSREPSGCAVPEVG